MSNLNRIIQDFLVLKRPKTRHAYLSALKALNISILKITPISATHWIASERERGMSDATICQRLALLRHLCRHLKDCGLIDNNAWDTARRALPRGQARQIRPTATIPLSLIRRFLDLPSRRSRYYNRDRALLALMFGGAMRRSEIIALNCGDFVTWGIDGIAVIVRHSKAGKYQEQPLPRWARDRFATLISERKSQGASESDPVFISDRKTRISESTTYRIFKRYAKQLGLNAAPHAARAAATTKYLIDTNGDIHGAQRLLRHSSPARAIIYDKRRMDRDENPANKLNF